MKDVSNKQFWQDIYDSSDTGWDLGTPTPVFVHIREERTLAPGAMLVPGCGRGYDAVHYAIHGFDVTAVDFAQSAIDAVNTNAAHAGVTVHAEQEDIFTLGVRHPAAFDYVLEYTCYCAIAPERRAEYARVIGTVLKPGGLLIGLFFPMDARDGGPPFAVSEEQIVALFSPEMELISSEFRDDSISPRRGKEKLMIWKRRGGR